MKLEWLEDLLALYSERTLTAAAERRNISQPAFSRRIKSLEDWLGVTLLDRSAKPASFTKAASDNERLVRSLISSIYEFRAASQLRAQGEHVITIGSQHSLDMRPLIDIIEKRKDDSIAGKYRVFAGDRQECILRMLRGEIDVLYCYSRPDELTPVPPTVAKSFVVSHDSLVPYCAPDFAKQRRRRNSARPQVPVLAYPPDSFLGGLLWESKFLELATTLDLQITYVSSFSYALIDLAMSGHGVAWLPERFARQAVKERKLMRYQAGGAAIPLNSQLAISKQLLPELGSIVPKFIRLLGTKQA